MGDTFDCLATSISSSGGPYSIWLILQPFVIIRVKFLRNLVFVGSKRSILVSIEQLLSNANLQEQHIFNLKTMTDRKQPTDLQLNQYSYIPSNVDITAIAAFMNNFLTSLTS